MKVFATGARARTADFEAGDVGYVQQTLPHYIENTGDTDLRFLEMFKSSFYQDLALSEWLSHATTFRAQAFSAAVAGGFL
ncbi:MAG: cupin domain-containing protein [Candidatus Sulfotelmatobacter sp.]